MTVTTLQTAPVEYRDQPAFDQGAPGLKEVYHMQMGDQLADADAEELMLGATGQVPNGTHHENVWVEAFEEVRWGKKLHACMSKSCWFAACDSKVGYRVSYSSDALQHAHSRIC